mgnify:CR=1 FL=1|tara:strand:+ start:143 stop:910 length:768 start_codon:yes stop_codon:yes gene_type:complete
MVGSKFSLNNKVILVTGACGQLGKIICQGLLDMNAFVIGSDSNIIDDELIHHDNISYVSLDISKGNSVKKIFRELYEKNDSIDVLINNAGVSTFEPFEERSEKQFDWVFDVNLKGTFLCIKEYHYHQKKNNKGNIINIASVYGLISPDPRIYKIGDRKNSEIYGATKAGVIQMTKYFAVHLAEDKIRVNAISPGGVYNKNNPQSEEFILEYSIRNPMGRMANSDEILGGIYYLASDISSYTNGHNLIMDGGMSCW